MAASRICYFHWLAGGGSMLLTGLLFSLTSHPVSGAGFHVSLAYFMTVAAYLLLPVATGISGLLAGSALATALFLLLACLPIAAQAPFQVSLQLGLVVFYFALLLGCLARLRYSRITVLFLLAVITSAPLWLSPVADAWYAEGQLINAIVAINPLTHFSVAAGYDYLRGDWLYRHSAFGSLPFAYPGLATITAGYTGLVICAFLLPRSRTSGKKTLEWSVKNRPERPPGQPEPPEDRK